MTEKARPVDMSDEQDSPERDNGFDEEAGKDTGRRADGGVVPIDEPIIEDEGKKKAAPAVKAEKPAKAKDEAGAAPADGLGKGKEKPVKEAATPDPDAETEPKTALEKAEAEGKKILDGDGKAVKPDGDASAGAEKPVIERLPKKYRELAAKIQENGQLVKWLDEQPEDIRAKAESSDVDDAIDVLDLFRESQGKSPAAAPVTPTEKKVVKTLIQEFGGRKFTLPDGTEKTIAQMAEEYGDHDLIAAVGSMAEAIIEARMAGISKPEKNELADKLQSRVDQLEQQAARNAYWREVGKKHSDGEDIFESGALKEWVGTQSPAIQAMYKRGHVSDAVELLSAYKEAKGTEAVGGGGGRKNPLTALHSETVGGRKTITPAKKSGEEKPEDYDSGFEEESKKK